MPISLGVMGSIGATGEWRILRPEISREKCNRCGMCYLYCPEGTMIFKNGRNPVVDLTYCKGCGICIHFCPRKVLELDEFDKVVAVRPQDCVCCKLCELRCPDLAIEVQTEQD